MPRRPSAKQLAKAQERFKTALTDYIISKGARPGRFYDHELDTPAGLLHVSVYGDWIATRFDDVEAGRRFTRTVARLQPVQRKMELPFFHRVGRFSRP